MILPTKHITIEDSMLGVGALLLSYLEQPKTVSTLWEKVREYSEISTFERFTLGLDLLFLIDAIDFQGNKIRRKNR